MLQTIHQAEVFRNLPVKIVPVKINPRNQCVLTNHPVPIFANFANRRPPRFVRPSTAIRSKVKNKESISLQIDSVNRPRRSGLLGLRLVNQHTERLSLGCIHVEQVCRAVDLRLEQVVNSGYRCNRLVDAPLCAIDRRYGVSGVGCACDFGISLRPRQHYREKNDPNQQTGRKTHHKVSSYLPFNSSLLFDYLIARKCMFHKYFTFRSFR
mmetsp:Transcript_21692/g.45797  ORF Transcript_21692/g.45797 Transcript_21692/m.45797 type:complete len:210 (+) Transcript_21692:991-1620(+)